MASMLTAMALIVIPASMGTDPCPNSSGRDFAEIVKVAQTDGAPDVRLDTAFRSSSSHFAIQGGILNGNAEQPGRAAVIDHLIQSLWRE